jgi:acylphosphatase
MRVRASYGGRVQGVGFRATTRAIAGTCRVTGWVRNEPDGTVTIEAQGEPEEVNRFLDVVERALARFISVRQRIDVADAATESGPFVIQR